LISRLLVVICLFSPKNQQTANELKSNGAGVQAKKAKISKFFKGWMCGA